VVLGHNSGAAKKNISRSQACAANEITFALFWDVTKHGVVIPLGLFGTIQQLNFLTLELETDGLSRKAGKELPAHAA
jgi:hypothetical protein